MRLAPLLLTVALAAPIPISSAFAPSFARADDSHSTASAHPSEGSVPEIVLVGEDPVPPPAPPDMARSGAVEDFLAARQDASIDRSLAARLRRELATRGSVPDEVLLGPAGASMIAFDYDDGDIYRAEDRAGGFNVTATALFASPDGQVIETRDEELTFVPSGEGYACVRIVPTNVISWDATVAQRASDAGIARDLDRLKEYWRRPENPEQVVAFSISDVERRPGGDVVVSCLRYTANPGQRGFETNAASVVITKQDGSFQLESH